VFEIKALQLNNTGARMDVVVVHTDNDCLIALNVSISLSQISVFQSGNHGLCAVQLTY